MAKADKHAGGRPTLLDAESQNILLQSIEAGLTLRMACACANLAYNTVYEWKRRGLDGEYNGREGNEAYEQFAKALTQAEEKGKAAMLLRWQQFFPTDWRAIRDYMARRWPEEWAATEAIKMQHSGSLATTSDEAAELERLLKNDSESAELIKQLYERKLAISNAGTD